jgi:uracil-DNA glycosylase
VLADIATVRPKLIVALGKSAASLFGASTAINSARRQVFSSSNRYLDSASSCCAGSTRCVASGAS